MTEESRRDFLRRMAALAFVVPVISSFALDAGATSLAPETASLPNQFYGNQPTPSLLFANQTFPNQYVPNQISGWQGYSNQITVAANQY